MIRFDENTLAGIAPVAGNGPGGPLRAAWPGTEAPATLTKGQLARLNGEGAKRFPFLRKMVGEAAGTVVGIGDSGAGKTASVEFLTPEFSGVVSALASDFDPEALQEKAPPDEEVEAWILANKAEFKKRYGKEWRRFLYGHAWKLHGKKKHRKAMKESYAVVADGRAFVYGPPGSGKVSDLREMVLGMGWAEYQGEAPESADLGYPGVAAVALEEAGDWKQGSRSLTAGERGDLAVAHDALGCTVCHVPGKGYAAYTHRARSKFYPTVKAIPPSVLKFIGSTG
jgi:hypothetical protein